jgi:hypothetical protein
VSNNTSTIARIINSGTSSNTNLEISHITNQNRIRLIGNIVNNADLNSLSSANDVGIIYGQTGVNTGGLVIAPNTTPAVGIRMALNGNVGFGVSVPQTTVDISGVLRVINNNGVITLQGNSQSNMGVGSSSLTSITTGTQNTALGYNTFNALSTGSLNTAVGYNAFNSAATTIQSTAIGYNAQPTASNQVVLGTATENVYIPGTTASQSTTTGALQVVGGVGVGGNVIVGGSIGVKTNTPAYALDVLGTINASTSVCVNGVPITGGGGSSQWTTLAGNIYYMGNVGIGTTLPQYTLDISGTSRITGSAYANYFITTSDYRIKKDPQPLGNLYSVDSLKPVQYTNILSNKQDMGFLAHEVQEVYPFLVEGVKDGYTTQSLNYQGLIAVLVKEIQDLKKRVAILENK